MVTDIVQQVVGDYAVVEGLMGEGVDPRQQRPRLCVAALLDLFPEAPALPLAHRQPVGRARALRAGQVAATDGPVRRFPGGGEHGG